MQDSVCKRRKPRPIQGKFKLLMKSIEEEKARFIVRSKIKWFNHVKGKIINIKGGSASSLCNMMNKKKKSDKLISAFVKIVNVSQGLEKEDLSKSK